MTAVERRGSGLAVMLILLPSAAVAHTIPPIVAGLALSPVVAILLACVYGILEGRWRVLVINLLLISLWVVLFGLAASFVTPDYVIWTPIVAMMAHIAILVGLVVWKLIKRGRTED